MIGPPIRVFLIDEWKQNGVLWCAALLPDGVIYTGKTTNSVAMSCLRLFKAARELADPSRFRRVRQGGGNKKGNGVFLPN